MYNGLDIIKFAKFEIFNQDNRNYVYSVDDNKIFEVDYKTLQLISQDNKTYDEICHNTYDIFTKDEMDNLLDDMNKYQFIKSKDNHEHEYSSTDLSGDLGMITLLIIQSCNLRCSYCYGEDGNYSDSGIMDIETAKKSVDFLINKSNRDFVTVCFFGGEPLLNFELIKEVVSYCRKKEKTTNKRIGFSMTTNGTLINREIEEFIIENRIKVQISIDGDKDIHDLNRYYDGKIGSHDTVIKKTELLRKNGLLDARATVTGKGLNLISIYQYLKSLGFRKVALSPAFNLLSDNEYDLLADSYIELFLYFEKLIKNEEFDNVIENKLFMQELRQVNNYKKRTIACGVGRNLYAVDIHGEIYPCQRFVSNKDFSIGNVFTNDEKQRTFVNNIITDNYNKCNSCWTKNLCVSGCSHTNLLSTGDINKPYDPFCEYTKKIKREIINIYLRLTPEEKNILLEGKRKLSDRSKMTSENTGC